ARPSTLQFRDTTKSIAAIGGELGAHYILEGSVRQAGERVRVTAQLIQVSDQTQLWARPLSASVQKLMFFVHLAGRRWQKAEDAVRRLAKGPPDDSSHIYFASFLLALRGDCSGARDQLAGRAPLRVGSGVTDEDYVVAYILGRCGTPREVAREVTSLEMRPQNYAQTIAVLYAGAGDRANALRWLEESFRRREPLLFFVAVDPSLEFLRSEPRLQALLQKMGLQQN